MDEESQFGQQESEELGEGTDSDAEESGGDAGEESAGSDEAPTGP